MKTHTKQASIDDIPSLHECLHIFFIVNPVTAIVAKMFIAKHAIPDQNILIFSLRNADVSIFNEDIFFLKENFFEKLKRKFLNIPTITKKFLNQVEKKNKKFIFYCSWAFHESDITPSAALILKSKSCIGHYYIEEGQASYSQNKPYDPHKFEYQKTKYIADSNCIFRNDSLGFISLFNDAFPMAAKEKRICVNNFEYLKSIYNPKLIGIHHIGLTCATRRINDDGWETMLAIIIQKMPNGGLIKLHPSFLVNKKTQNRIESIFKKIAPDNISLCPNDVILEIEMLFEKKILIGPLTSLNRYAKNFGSEFIDIKIY